MKRHECPVVFATHGPGNHFFGYYDKSPLSRSGRRLLSHRAAFEWKRMPLSADEVEVGYWDMDADVYHAVGSTHAYNWQQGAQLQWLPPDFESRIVFNDREGERFVARIVDLVSGDTRTLPFPVYTVNPDGLSAICVNYERLAFTHPGYDYQGVVNPRWDGPLPEGDGLFRMDLATGDVALVVPSAELVEFAPIASMAGAKHYLEHAMYNSDGSRFCFLHRWGLPDGGIYARLFTADADGTQRRCLLDSGSVSHFGWRGPKQISAWARPPSALAGLRRSRLASRWLLRPLLPLYRAITDAASLERGRLTGDTYLLLDDAEGSVATLAPGVRWPDDGHCSWRPGDPRWMLTDTYEDAEFRRHLLLYDHDAGEVTEIGRFYSVRETCDTGFRCDLHPRWDHSGGRVCIDSSHRGDERQMYVVDVSEVVGD